MHRDPVEVEQGRQPEGDDEPHVEQDGGEESVPAGLHHQPCRQGDHERGQDHQPPASGPDSEPQAGQERTGHRHPGHHLHTGPVLAAGVAHRREQRGERRGEEVLLLVQCGEDHERHQHAAKHDSAPLQVEPSPVEHEQLR